MVTREYHDLIESFDAVSDSGHSYKVHVYEKVREDTLLDGKTQKLRSGLRDYRLDNGAHLNPLGSDNFEIVQTGEIIRKFG